MPSASQLPAPGFLPGERPRVAIAADGTLAAIAEPRHVTVLDLPGGGPIAEIGIDATATASDVAWVGTPPRLLVLSRYPTHSTVHLIDPSGPRTIAEIRLEAPMQLFATVGAHALVVGSLGAAVLTAGESHLTPYQFPARAMPACAGPAGGQFLVALAASIEEWDPHNRMPKRRLRLPRPATITAVGGSERVVWMTTQQAPNRIDVIPLVNRGQPKLHELPEPIAYASGHPRSDLVVCIGAVTGRPYVVDLDGRTRMRVIGPDGLDRTEAAALVIGRVSGIVAVQAARPVAIVALATADVEADAATIAPPLLRSPREPEADPPSTARSTLGMDDPDDDEAAPPARARPSWRDDTVAWARAAAAGADGAPPSAPAIEALAARFELAPALVPAVVLLYGAHLAGDSAAPVDIARVLGGRWDEALGRGQLAGGGLVIHAGSRVRLADPILRALDELPAITGTLVGAPGPVALLGPCAVVATDGSLPAIAERILASVGGAILAAIDGSSTRELYLEARARGAAPMLRLAAALEELAAEPAIFVVADASIAEQLGVPRL